MTIAAETNASTYYVMTAAAKMPNSSWGRYGRVAIVEVDVGGTQPKIIRDTKTARVVCAWERQHIGSTDSCAYFQAYDAAVAKCAALQKRANRNARRRAARAAKPVQ